MLLVTSPLYLPVAPLLFVLLLSLLLLLLLLLLPLLLMLPLLLLAAVSRGKKADVALDRISIQLISVMRRLSSPPPAPAAAAATAF